MSLDDVEGALQRYANEIEQTQLVLQQTHRNLVTFLEENHALLVPEWHQQVRAYLDELNSIEASLSEQLLVDMNDATQFRLSILRRYLHES